MHRDVIGGRTGGGGEVAPPLFRLRGHGPSIFLTVLFQNKRHPNRHAVKCLTWWKIVHQIASFKTTFSKELPLLKGATSPLRHPPVSHKHDGWWLAIFYYQNLAPPSPTLKIVLLPMRNVMLQLWPWKWCCKPGGGYSHIWQNGDVPP